MGRGLAGREPCGLTGQPPAAEADTQALQLGPLALPWSPLVLAVAAAAGLSLGQRAGRRAGLDVETVLLRMLLLGLLAARLAFVWLWRSNYLHEPLGVLDIRDGGWEATAGFAAAFLYGLAQVRKLPVLRQPVLVAAVTTLLLWTAGEVAVAAWTASPGKPLPPLSLVAADGTHVDLTRYAGKPTVVNLWATWCPPCRREMPLLQQAQVAHPDVNFVFVNQGESREDVLRYLAGSGLTLGNVLLDARRATGAAFQEGALPTTLFFDAEGHLVATRVGALSEATLAQRLQALQPVESGAKN